MLRGIDFNTTQLGVRRDSTKSRWGGGLLVGLVFSKKPLYSRVRLLDYFSLRLLIAHRQH